MRTWISFWQRGLTEAQIDRRPPRPCLPGPSTRHTPTTRHKTQSLTAIDHDDAQDLTIDNATCFSYTLKSGSTTGYRPLAGGDGLHPLPTSPKPPPIF